MAHAAQAYAQHQLQRRTSGARKSVLLLPTGVVNAPTVMTPGVTEPPAPIWKKWWFWTAIGGSVLALGTGTYFVAFRKG